MKLTPTYEKVNVIIYQCQLFLSSDRAKNCSTDWETKLLCSSSHFSPSSLQLP